MDGGTLDTKSDTQIDAAPRRVCGRKEQGGREIASNLNPFFASTVVFVGSGYYTKMDEIHRN